MNGCVVGKFGASVVAGSLMLSLGFGCGSSSQSAALKNDCAVAAPAAPVSTSTPTPAPARQQIAMAATTPDIPVRAGVEDVRPLHPTELHVQHERLTTEQVAMWAQQGMRDDIIIDRIERAQTIIRLSAAEEQSLRQQGVSEDVIFALKETARR